MNLVSVFILPKRVLCVCNYLHVIRDNLGPCYYIQTCYILLLHDDIFTYRTEIAKEVLDYRFRFTAGLK